MMRSLLEQDKVRGDRAHLDVNGPRICVAVGDGVVLVLEGGEDFAVG